MFMYELKTFDQVCDPSVSDTQIDDALDLLHHQQPEQQQQQLNLSSTLQKPSAIPEVKVGITHNIFIIGQLCRVVSYVEFEWIRVKWHTSEYVIESIVDVEYCVGAVFLPFHDSYYLCVYVQLLSPTLNRTRTLTILSKRHVWLFPGWLIWEKCECLSAAPSLSLEAKITKTSFSFIRILVRECAGNSLEPLRVWDTFSVEILYLFFLSYSTHGFSLQN